MNEASRLEGLCKTLQTNLALSETFCLALDGAAVPDIVDLGEHALKGVKARVGVFTRRSSGSTR